MFDGIKRKLAFYVAKNKLAKKTSPTQMFNDFFKKSNYFLVIISEDEKDFYNSFDVVKYLLLLKKSVTIFINKDKLKLIQNSNLVDTLVYCESDMTRLKLPSKDFRDILRKKNFEVTMDLNRRENLFCSSVANLVNSDVRFGFKKSGADYFYNFQFANSNSDAEFSFKKIINSLQMF